jgi:hypothetical protein
VYNDSIFLDGDHSTGSMFSISFQLRRPNGVCGGDDDASFDDNARFDGRGRNGLVDAGASSL